MQEWQYGMALYQRKPNERATIDCRGSELPMNDVDQVKVEMGLLSFLKSAGKMGWELCSNIAPWPEGQRLSDHKDDETDGTEYTIEDRFEIQWLIFKRKIL